LLAATGAAAAALEIQSRLDTEQAEIANKAPASAEDAKFLTQRTRTLLLATPAAQHSAALGLADQSIALLKTEANDRPYSAIHRRELAVSAHRLGVAAQAADAALACRWLTESAAAFALLAQAKQVSGALAAMVVSNAALRQKRCASG
jgi:hypothetical protein